MHADGTQLKTLADLYDAGILEAGARPHLPFDRTLDALAYVEQGKANGKTVITHGETP